MKAAIRVMVAGFGTRIRAASGACQAVGTGGLLLLAVCLAFAAPGCGNTKTKAPAAQPAAAEAEENAEAPVEKAPAKVEKKPAAPPPVVRHRPNDPSKWELVDLQTGLAAHDSRFLLALMIFATQHSGAKPAGELQALLERAGQMKDDPSISLPLSPAPVAAPVTASKPVTPAPGATPPAQGPAPGRRAPRRMGAFGGR